MSIVKHRNGWIKEAATVVGGLVLVLLAGFLSNGLAATPSTNADGVLSKSLTITWSKGPDLPQGFQDSDGGIAHHMLITVGGFCAGQTVGVVNKEGKYPRGFLKKVWGLDLNTPQKGWRYLPDFPGAPRQGLFGMAVKDQIYVWGGFSYSPPYTYKDGYRLSDKNGQWQWQRMPDLPWPLADGAIAAIGSKIYISGGADYDRKDFYTNAERHGDVKRLGSRLIVFDTENPTAGWKELAPSPGTPRFANAAAGVKGIIYIIGGATGNDNSSGNYATVVDNWRYDPATNKWSRLPDTPIASGNFPSGRIVFDDRYIVLVGGFQYKDVLNTDGTLRKPYGEVFRHYKNNPYDSDIFVFDTQTSRFGSADPLPLNNNGPMTVLQGNHLYLIGGETGGAVIQDEYFGHHPDLFLIGAIRKTAPSN